MTNEQIFNKMHKRRSRHVRSPDNLGPIRLTGRDLEILLAVGDYRILSTSQIKRLFFRSIHKARKRLFKLWQHRLLDRRFQPVRIGESQPETLYVLSRQGARMVALRGGLLGEAGRLTPFERQGSSLFLDHTLARNDVRIALQTAVRHEAGRHMEWRQDKGITGVVNVITGTASPRLQRIALIADGRFLLKLGNCSRLFYLEVDRGTISLSRWRTRATAYSVLLRRMQRSLGDTPFLVLVTTPSEIRARHIGEVVSSVSQNGHPLFFFAPQRLFAETSEDLIAASIWGSYGREATKAQELESLEKLTGGKPAARRP